MIRWGILGAGDIADRVMAPAMRTAPNSHLVAVMRRSMPAAEAFAAKHGAARAYDTVEGLVADPEVDAIYVATPVHRHRPDVLAAAAAGKDVLVEKPIALTADEGREMVAACAAAGVRLGTCFYQRYNARHRRIRELLAANAIGQVATVNFNFSGRSPDAAGAWRQDPALAGGGAFIDSASHCVDLLRFLFGEVEQLLAFTGTIAASHQVEDTSFGLFRMVSGVHAVITAHWSVTDPSDARSSVLQIGGTNGTLVSWPLHDKFSRGTLILATSGDEDEIEVTTGSTHTALLEDFAAARAAGRPFPITGEDGVAAQAIVDAVYRSSRLGELVRL